MQRSAPRRLRQPSRRRLLVSALLVAAGVAASVRGEEGAVERPPNVLLILADDLGYGDPRCYNPESKIPTPSIDRLAREGVRLTDAHSPSAVCTPTRYGLLTGRYAWRTRLEKGVLGGWSPALIEPGRTTIATLLRERGYATACFGKWHLGLGDAPKTDYSKALVPGPRAAGFERFFGIPASLDMEPYVFVEGDRVVEAPTGHVDASEMRRNGGKGFWRAGPIAPSFRHIDVLPAIERETLEYLEARSAETGAARRPFFLYVALTAPHTPWLPTPEFEGKSGAGPYGDFAVQVDAVVGRILDALDRGGLAAGTLVVFTSDNGAHWLPKDIETWSHRSNGALRGQKADIHEGGHRVPFLARWPGRIRAGTVCAETVCHVDLLATFAAAVGAKLPADAGEDSHDILPALLGKPLDRPVREATVHHSGSGTFAIRQGDWKLILGKGSGGFTKVREAPGDPPGQLYHLGKDPGETRNLWTEEPETVRRLTELLERYRASGRSRPAG